MIHVSEHNMLTYNIAAAVTAARRGADGAGEPGLRLLPRPANEPEGPSLLLLLLLRLLLLIIIIIIVTMIMMIISIMVLITIIVVIIVTVTVLIITMNIMRARSAFSSHGLDSQTIELRVSNPRTVACLDLTMPYESSNLPGAGPIFPD